MSGKRGYHNLIDDLDDRVREAAWSKAGMEPNGQLDDGTFFWPRAVRTEYDLIGRTVHKLRRERCECKKKKQLNGCGATEQLALRSLKHLGLTKDHHEQIAKALAALAHSKPVGDRSAD